MTREIMVQFVGFESRALVRVYTFTVREASVEPREYTLAIANKAFVDHRIRYQDAPDICSLRLRRELAAFGNHPPASHLDISDGDLDDYSGTHARQTTRSPYGRKAAEDR